MSDNVPPKIDNAPGLTFNARKSGWEARWQARTDLVARGYEPKSTALCIIGPKPNDIERAFISDRCQALQSEMLVWGRGGLPTVATFDGSMKGLIQCYQTDPDSRFHGLEYVSRQNYVSLMRRLIEDCGDQMIADIKARELLRWHEQWVGKDNHIPMAHSLIGMVRTLTTFGATILDSPECRALKVLLGDMRFKMPKARTEYMTIEQVDAVRAKAVALDRPSIALAQAFQFEGILRQKDVIGEWVPLGEPGTSEILDAGFKWLKGLRWSEIDDNMVVHHLTWKRKKPIEPDLKLAPMVIEELQRAYPGCITVYENPRRVEVNRSMLPSSGPVIVYEVSGVPYRSHQFRKQWREIAIAAGVPRNVFNMDTRASAGTEASDAGVPMEHIRQAMTHSNISTTERYSRNPMKKTHNTQQGRLDSRKNRA